MQLAQDGAHQRRDANNYHGPRRGKGETGRGRGGRAGQGGCATRTERKERKGFFSYKALNTTFHSTSGNRTFFFFCALACI